MIRQLRRQMLRVLGEGGRYLRLQPPFLPFPRLPFSDHRMNTALLPTCLRSHSPTQARLQTIHAASARPCLPGCFIIPLTLPKYYGRLRYLKKNHQQLIDTRQIPYASRCFVCCFTVVSDSLRPHDSQHARPPCPSPTPGVHSNSCPSSR